LFFSVAIGLLVISSGVTMSVPFALGKVIDIIYSMDQLKSSPEKLAKQKGEITETLNKVCLILVGVFALGGLANFGRVYHMRLAAQNITARLRNSLFAAIVKQEASYFDRTKTGELINRLSADSQLVSQAVTTQISDGLRSALMTTAGIGMMFFMSPQLALVSLGVVPPVALWGVWMGRKVRSTSRNVQDALANSTHVAEERISNIRTVRAFAKEDLEIQRYAKEMSIVLDKSVEEAMVQAKFYGMVIF
jgi:ATP-binding cassette subfamily B (MDR/TAP) protein 10